MKTSGAVARLMRSGGGAALLAVLLAPDSQACAVCMGDPASPTADAANAAIFVMLGCVGGVLGLLSAFGIYLCRRANLPNPPHAEFNEELDAQPEGGHF